MNKILLIEDDITFSNMLKHFLERNQYIVDISYTIKNAFSLLKKNSYNLIFTDLRLPDGDGINFLKQIKKNNNVPVVLMTSYAEVTTAVQAMKQGAFDYVSKPFNPDEVIEVIKNALDEKSKNNIITKNLIQEKGENNIQFIKGISPASKTLYEYIDLVAPTNMSVLINGESGTGKEVVAKTIHKQSTRKNYPFIAVDCGAIPKEIASSEFFGHKKGAFTGATNHKTGHFEAANNGTLFLDEIGNLSYENQIQLLRALQERKIKPVGSSEEITVNIRLITATNENLLKAVEEGDFREDLYHRINEFSIKTPSLKDRNDDLVLYADFFLNKANQELNKAIIGFSQQVLTIFQSYHWPGNLRELSNIIKRATLLSQTKIIEKDTLPDELKYIEDQKLTSNKFSTKENQKKLILEVLNKVGNNKTKAAKLLNITRKTLYNKINEYNLN